MIKQFAIIGLGNFGYYLATHLYDKGHEVIGIDKNHKRVQQIKEKVSQAVVADATDRQAMESLEITQMDMVAVCIGSVLSDSILATLSMKDIGVKNLAAMAISEDHGRILYKLGVSEIFFPEKDMAITAAERLHNPNMLDYLPFIEGYSIIQLSPPKSFLGKTLRDLNLINLYGIQVLGIKDVLTGKVNLIPTAQFVIKDSDIMILLGPNETLDKLNEGNDRVVHNVS